MGAPDRLRSAAAIRRAVGGRRAAGAASLVVHAHDRADGASARVAVVAGRRVGGAVTRNRAKRRLRAAAAEVPLPRGHDLVITARSGADVIAYDRLVDELREAVRRASSKPRSRAVAAR